MFACSFACEASEQANAREATLPFVIDLRFSGRFSGSLAQLVSRPDRSLTDPRLISFSDFSVQYHRPKDGQGSFVRESCAINCVRALRTLRNARYGFNLLMRRLPALGRGRLFACKASERFACEPKRLRFVQDREPLCPKASNKRGAKHLQVTPTVSC